jgi:hypothetical protein
MKQPILKLYHYARKRFLQAELNKLTDIEKDREVCAMIAFIVGQGLTTNYRVFKDMLDSAQKDDDIINAMKREKDE